MVGFACRPASSVPRATLGDLQEALCSADGKNAQGDILFNYNTPEIREKLGGDLREFLGQLGGLPTIIFNFNAEVRVKRWVAHGVRGLLYMTDPSQNMVKAVKAVTEGHMWIPR